MRRKGFKLEVFMYASAQVTLTRDEDSCQFQFAGAQR